MAQVIIHNGSKMYGRGWAGRSLMQANTQELVQSSHKYLSQHYGEEGGLQPHDQASPHYMPLMATVHRAHYVNNSHQLSTCSEHNTKSIRTCLLLSST